MKTGVQNQGDPHEKREDPLKKQDAKQADPHKKRGAKAGRPP